MDIRCLHFPKRFPAPCTTVAVFRSKLFATLFSSVPTCLRRGLVLPSASCDPPWPGFHTCWLATSSRFSPQGFPGGLRYSATRTAQPCLCNTPAIMEWWCMSVAEWFTPRLLARGMDEHQLSTAKYLLGYPSASDSPCASNTRGTALIPMLSLFTGFSPVSA